MNPETGALAQGFFTLPDGRTVYYGGDNTMQFGKQNIGGNDYLFSAQTGALLGGGEHRTPDGWVYVNPETGALAKGFTALPDGRTVYYGDDNTLQFGAKTIGGFNYQFSPQTGALLNAGEQRTADGWVYVNPTTGALAQGFFTLPDGRLVYYGENKTMQLGGKNISGFDYQFSALDGALLNTGEQRANGGWVYVSPTTGALAQGLTTLPDGRTVLYGSNNIMQFGDVMWNSQPFRLNTQNGNMLTGEQFFENVGWTYRNPASFNLARGFTTLPDGRTVFYGDNYAMRFGSFSYEGGVYYANNTGDLLRGWYEFGDGFSRYFDASTGKMALGWQQLSDGLWYYFDLADGAYLNSTTAAPTFAQQVFDIVNQTRVAAGHSTLRLSTNLMVMAIDRAREIVGVFDHTRPDGRPWSSIFTDYEASPRYNFSWSYIGENIAQGYASAAAVMQAWMDSPGHAANILGSNYNFTEIGIGVYIDTHTGRMYWAQLFGG